MARTLTQAQRDAMQAGAARARRKQQHRDTKNAMEFIAWTRDEATAYRKFVALRDELGSYDELVVSAKEAWQLVNARMPIDHVPADSSPSWGFAKLAMAA